ncbi:MAG: AraC family transcriptional regulator [Cyclobacteriaceae bacterium]
MSELIEFIAGFGIAQSVLLGAFLLIKQGKIRPLRFMGILLLLEAYILAEQLLYLRDGLSDFPYLLGLSYPLAICRPVLVYFFAKAYFDRSATMSRHQWVHLLPFLVYVVLFAPLIFSAPETKLAYLNSVKGDIWTSSLSGILFFTMYNIIHGIYYYLTWGIISNVRNLLPLNANGQATLISNALLVYIGAYLIKVVLYVAIGTGHFSIDLFGNAVMVFSSFTIQLIAWFLMGNSRWPVFNPSKPPSEIDQSRLRDKIEHEKAYLDDGLTLNGLAHQLGMGSDRMGELFRMTYQDAFKETINRLRVIEAQRLIELHINDPRMNLLAIALSSGFNNKVTFYRAFKKFVGHSPSEFQNQLKSTIAT